MTGDVESIFHAAREIADRVQRAAFLDEKCGNNTTLRAKVEALLRADARAGVFLKTSEAEDPDVTLPDEPSLERTGAMIGRYKLLEQIGEGGFGTVWAAEQREPVKRRIALKIIKLGMDTRQVIARFEAERQALAMMDHPNIAKVLDAGSTETGRPYFVMELVRGVPILEYCDTEKLDTKARLRLFMQVCHAIQHAHQKGIIHRDIKPSNVLVTLHDGKPIPKVIDFGIAKATNAELTEKTLYTQHRQMVGTPAYMSPEQAEMSGLDIDTRSDIYALGVLLYELLTGTTPFDSKSLMEAGFAEMMRIIRDDTPHKPSTRLSTLGEMGTRTALQRHTDVKRLGLILRGDLDWIVMKCLEKDRTRRYETANGLATDIKRHLSDEPVVAGPPSARYRLQKFIKRNRGQVIGAGAIAAILVLGIMGTSTGMVWAMRAERDAVAQRDLAAEETTQKEKALGEKEVALQRARDETAAKDVALRRTRVLALTMASAEAADSDTMRALLLAREAGRTSMLPAVITQLHSALQGSLERSILGGHEAEVTAAVFSPTGDRVLTASVDTTARVWNLAGEEIATLRGHEAPLWSAVFSPSGELILTASEDQTARLWDRDGKELAVFPVREFQVRSAAFSPTDDRVLTVPGPSTKEFFEAGKTVRLWDFEGNELAALHGHEDGVNAAVFSPSGEQILTASKDKTARIWDLEGNELAVFQGHDANVFSAVFSPSGEQVLSAGDKTARLWDLEGNELAVFRGHAMEVVSALFSPSGDRILTVSRDETARLWDLDGNELVQLSGNEWLHAAAFSPSGDRIMTVSMVSVRLWNLAGTELAALRGHEKMVISAVFSPAGDRIVTAGDEVARLWEVEGKELGLLSRHDAPLSSVAYSPSGDQIVTASFDATARLWNLEGNELAVLRGHEGFVSSAAVSPAGDRIVTAGSGGARVWDLEGNELAVLTGHEAMIMSAAFSPSGDRIVTAGYDNTARIWDLEGNQLAVIQHEGGFHPNSGPNGTCVTSAVFSPSGDRILTSSFDDVARIWDLEGNELTVFRGHEDRVARAVYSPSGDRILTASHDTTARLWDLDGNELAILRGHSNLVIAVAFSPSGDRILTGSLDQTARLWDLEGNQLAVLRGNGIVTAVAFSPSGDHMITGSDAARIWLVHGEDLLKLADERVTREFTLEERRRYADLLSSDTAEDR